MLSRVELSEAAFHARLVAELPMLRRYCRSLCKNDDLAEDLVQETACRALQSYQTSFDGNNIGAWLVVIARNYLWSRFRRNRLEEDPDDFLALKLVACDNPQIALEAKEALQLVDMLPSHFKDTLLLQADGASLNEIAKETVVQLGTVKSRINRGRELLKQGMSA